MHSQLGSYDLRDVARPSSELCRDTIFLCRVDGDAERVSIVLLTRAAQDSERRLHLGLTGTPIENQLVDLWSSWI